MTMGTATPDRTALREQRRQARKRRARRSVIASYVFIAPYIFLLLMFGLIPVAYAFGLSFFDTFEGVFWGLKNYQLALEDFRLSQSVINVLTYVAIWLVITVGGVTALSLMLDTLRRRPAAALRTVFFLPGAITSSAVVVLWLFLLDPQVSPFQAVFNLVGWETRSRVVDGIGYAGIFALMAFFAQSGGWIVVMGGSLASLSREVMEAASVDGANLWQQAIRVKLPMIWRAVALMGILTFAGGLQIFVEPQLMRLAGVRYSQADWSINQLAFQYAFTIGDFGVSAALSTMLLTASITIALIIIFVTKFYKID
ncbi:MAG: sugar ABC transporter permease [Alphaproteobacteria bacterium]|nr:sugar ABC transporter permease [Alphaproteobacteria bacterium]